MPRLAPVVHASARKSMKNAWDDLERTLTPADALEMRTIATIEHVRQAALLVETQLAARQSLRNMGRLEPLLNGMEHYAQVVGILCNGTPFLSWIWAPITLILRVASEFIEAFEQIMKGYSEIANALARFKLLNNAFTTNQDFQMSLASYYADILEFHRQAYVFVRRSSWKLLFLTSWGRFERRFTNLLHDLDHHGRLIDAHANACNIAESHKMRQELEAWKDKSMKILEKEDKDKQRKEFEAILAWLKADGLQQNTILDSTSIDKTLYPGTSAWLLQNDNMKSWLRRSPGTALLWLHGSPGTGKSVLTTELVHFLRSSDSLNVYHFCTYAYDASVKYDGILRSFLTQLLRYNGDLVNYIYQEHVLPRKLATVSVLERLLQTAIASLSQNPSKPEHIWLLIDAYNESETPKQHRLLNLLSQLSALQPDQTVVKVLITTRKLPSMSKRLKQAPVISLNEEGDMLTSAIRMYTSSRLQAMDSRLRQIELQAEEIEEIKEIIAQKSQGMFLYARLVLDYIGTNVIYDGNELKESIHQLPETLADFYNKLLVQILSNMNEKSQHRIKLVFGWIAFAKRPLKKSELLSALAFCEEPLYPTKLAPAYILDDTCGPLLSQKADTTLTFIHVTVKDYLQSPASAMIISELHSIEKHSIASTSCLLSGLQVFNQSYDEHDKRLRLVRGLHAFHVYATEYWTDYLLSSHVHQSDYTSDVMKMANKLAETLELTTAIPFSTEQFDSRVADLETGSLLQKHVACALKSRSLNRLDQEILTGTKVAEAKIPLDGISTMLNAYQQTVESILDLEFIPGVSAEELDVFKCQFRASAYTCRLGSCPRATLGFETAKLRHEHELSHTGGYSCSVAGCQFPPFKNSKALRTHTLKHHTPGRKWRPIRDRPKQESITPGIIGQGKENAAIQLMSGAQIGSDPSMFAPSGPAIATDTRDQHDELWNPLKLPNLEELKAFDFDRFLRVGEDDDATSSLDVDFGFEEQEAVRPSNDRANKTIVDGIGTSPGQEIFSISDNDLQSRINETGYLFPGEIEQKEAFPSRSARTRGNMEASQNESPYRTTYPYQYPQDTQTRLIPAQRKIPPYQAGHYMPSSNLRQAPSNEALSWSGIRNDTVPSFALPRSILPTYEEPPNLSEIPDRIPQHPALQHPVSENLPSAAAAIVTPTMWQDAVARSFPDGVKRR